jgi:diaminohydroxyphosphoribosylaminopyrimidine deaminase/5-amino-6-(5-phosphoribosylamino)uracil reductase
MSGSDEHWMRYALQLAARGRGAVEPNPMVGTVILNAQSELVGEGWHERFGEAHAEVNAFRSAREKACGGTLFVTLEPCSHFGKTPPCTDAVLASGVKRVVVAMTDPFPEVASRGIALLRQAGLDVEVGICESEAKRLNAPYLKLLRTGRPWVHLKWAMTLDGKIASRTGDSKWISGEASRRTVHEIRGRMDAIIVGRGTVEADDPLLTARPPGPRVATRVILASHLPDDCQLLRTAREIPTLIATAAGNEPRFAAWQAAGAEILVAQSIDDLLADFGRRRMTNVLVEGGAGVLGSFLDAGAADEVHVFVAPKLLGGTKAPSPVGGAGFSAISEVLRLADFTAVPSGEDIYLHGFLQSR